MRRCLAALLFALFALAGADCLAYTEISYDYFAFREEGERHTTAKNWKRYDDSDSEVDAVFDKSSIYYYARLPNSYAPFVATTNSSVLRNETTWEVIKTQTLIVESNNTGWVVSASGFQSNLWYKVFTYASNYYKYSEMTQYGERYRHSVRQGIRWTISIKKSSGMPKDPSWTQDVEDGEGSLVSTDTDFPVTYGWLRRYFPNDHHSQLTACADSQAPNGMKYWEAAMLMLDPADPDDGLLVGISLVDGKPKASALLDTDRYKDYGYVLKYGCKKSLADKQWHITADPEEMADYNFFKGVLLKE